jgi:hypothetical protein
VPGGGTALLRASKAIDRQGRQCRPGSRHQHRPPRAAGSGDPPDRRQRRCEGSDRRRQDLDQKTDTYGFNAQTGEYGDMIKMGIIDPAKVVRTALQDAASVAGLLITTEAMIAELPKKESAGGGGMPDMGGMGGMRALTPMTGCRRMDLLAAQLKQDELHDEGAGAPARCQRPDDRAGPVAHAGPRIADRRDRGRGGGVRLDPHWGVGRVNLSYPEAVDLLISIEVAEKMGSPMFLANLGSVRRHLVASFSPRKRAEVNRLKSRILIGVTASTYVQAGVTSPPNVSCRPCTRGSSISKRLRSATQGRTARPRTARSNRTT